MLNEPLLPESELVPHDAEIAKRVMEMKPPAAIDVSNTCYGRAFLRFLLFTHWPQVLREGVLLREEQRLYNQYYWFMKFARAYTHVHGPDVGLDQQAFQLLESAAVDINWGIVQAIKELVDASA